MPSRQKCTPHAADPPFLAYCAGPAGPEGCSPPRIARWAEDRIFRESFLLHVDGAEHREAVVDFGAWVYGVTLEAAGPAGESEESMIRQEMGAAARDLAHCASFLAHVGAQPAACDLEADEIRLCELAAWLAGEVQRTADGIDSALASSKPS